MPRFSGQNQKRLGRDSPRISRQNSDSLGRDSPRISGQNSEASRQGYAEVFSRKVGVLGCFFALIVR